MRQKQTIEMPAFRPKCVNCEEPATVWIRGGNVCHEHYMDVFRRESERYCAEHGLATMEDKISHVRELGARPKNMRAWTLNPKSQRAAEMAASLNSQVMALQPYTEREPGSDDE